MVIDKRHVSVFFLNVAQGLPGSFFGLGLPALLRDAGVSVDLVVLAYLTWAPWALKFLWGPSLDSGPFWFRASLGRVAAPPVLTAVAFASLGLLDPARDLWAVFALGIACAFTGATLQIVLARWIMVNEPNEAIRGSLNAAQVAGMIAGAMIGGTFAVWLADLVSFRFSALCIALLIAACVLPFELTQADPMPARVADRSSVANPLTGFRKLFGRPGVTLLLILMVASDLGTGADILLTTLLVDSGLDAVRVTLILGTVATACALPSTVLASRALKHWGKERVLGVLLFGKSVIFALIAWSAGGPSTNLSLLAILSIILSSVIAIAYWQFYMRVASTESAAGDIGLLTSFRTLLLMAGGIGVGQAFGPLGYTGVFSIAATLCLAATAIVLSGSLVNNRP